MNNNKEYILNLIKELYLGMIYGHKITVEEDRELGSIYEFVYLVIMDICHNEDVDWLDIEVIGRGNFSRVLRVGSKVVKIGSRRCKWMFPNNGYISAMLLRCKVNASNSLALILEVNELVDTDIMVTEKDLYQLYKRIRDLHLVWIDVKSENVGRLIRDNKIYWREDLTVCDEVLGLEEMIGDVILGKGELVIIDNDSIFREDSPNIVMNNRLKKLEERYQLKRSRD